MQIKGSVLTQKNGIREISYVTKDIKEELKDYTDFVLEFYSEFNKLKFSDVDFTLDEELAKFGKLVLEIFNQVLSIYEQKKKGQSLLDFEDILIKAKDVIKNQSVSKQLNEKYKYIMVDEYQDTNEIQYDIIMPILKYLDTGNLFIVGDEKQSIYRFRDAEPEIFRKTTTQIVDSVNESSNLNLPHSFRVSPPIAFFVNIVFKELFKNYNPEYNEVKYDELLCARPESETGKVEILLYDEENEEETEAILLAKKIIELSSENSDLRIKYGDIAILCRKRASFSELEEAFSKYKIPYAISGGKGFFQRQSIYDIFSFISFVLNPDDDIALFGILRSPFFSLPDTVLFEISLKQGKTFFKKFKNYAKENNVYNKIILMLSELIDFSKTSPIVLLLRKMLGETGYWSTIAAKKNAGQELANIEKLIQTANTYSHIGFKTLYDFKEYLDDAIKRVEDESQSPINDEDNSVKIMTVHQSKGLEFATVFLYKCNETTMTEAVKSKAIYIDKELGILAKIPKDENYFSNYRSAPIVSIYNYVVTRKSKAELKRLLYVAITRAKNNLFITASHKKYKFKEDSFIKLLASGLKTDFSENYVSISGKLNFMKSAEENYATYFKSMSITIPVITSIEQTSVSEKSKAKDKIVNKKILAEKIFDMEKNEIISATKIAYFNQCPVKYQLTYEYGYSKLVRLINVDTSDNSDDFKEEVNEYLPADIKGRVVHSILEKEIGNDIIKPEIEKLLFSEFQTIPGDDEKIKSYSEEIYSLLSHYYLSKTFKELQQYKNYKNEFEIYFKVNDYYLYGIIDKLIIDKEELVIVDYKTDKILKKDITKKAEKYIPQLMFYAFIVKNIYSNIKKIKLKLIFLNEPDFSFEKIVSSNELNEFGTTINNIIKKIRLKEFSPNLNHCSSCHLSDNYNKCPVK